jgi:hypothetical protein
MSKPLIALSRDTSQSPIFPVNARTPPLPPATTSINDPTPLATATNICLQYQELQIIPSKVLLISPAILELSLRRSVNARNLEVKSDNCWTVVGGNIS